MDELKKYFTDHRQEFDAEALPDDLWPEVAAELDGKPLNPTPSAPVWRYWAAAIALLLTLGSGWAIFKGNAISQGEIVASLDVGQPFPDLTLRDPDGTPVQLSSLHGKVVLVEFWASFSTVCTEQHCYYFQPIYNEYRDEGFEIYGVSLDSSATAWLAAIEHDGLDWINVTNLEGAESEYFEQFAVNDLPTTYLLDQTGRITAKNVDASELKIHLEDLLAQR